MFAAATIGPHTAVSVRVDALGGARIPAWVRAVVPSENAALRSVTLKVAVSSRPGLLPGMFARVSVPGSVKTQWAAPLQAIAERAGQTGVFRTSGGTAEGMTLLWLPKRSPELNPMDTLWGQAKDVIAANKQYATIDEQVGRFLRHVLPEFAAAAA